MDAAIVAAEFRRIFEVTRDTPRLARAQRTGQVDSSRIALVGGGSTRVFAQHQRQAVPTVAGSLAICTSLCDLDVLEQEDQHRNWAAALPDARGDKYRAALARVAAYRATIETLHACAVAAHLPVRIFATAWDKAHTPGAVERRVVETPKALWALTPINSWLRQRECIQMAEEWHQWLGTGAGRRVTLLVTQLSEVRSPEACQKRDAYLRELAETASTVAGWTRHSRFYAVGVDLPNMVATGGLWGQNVEYGVHNHFRACFPAGVRYLLESQPDLPRILREIAAQIGRGGR